MLLQNHFKFSFQHLRIFFQPECYYRGFRDDSGTFTPVHWKILALKFAFVIIFEHVVFGVCKLIDVVVPDIPESLDIKVKRERYLAKEALQDADHVLQKVRRKNIKKCLPWPQQIQSLY